MRVQFMDELQTRGELELRKVKIGDRVLFNRAYWKGGIEIDSGTHGEVVGTQQEHLVVEANGVVHTPGGFETETRRLSVEPDIVTILVDSRDTRLGSSRVTAALPQDLDTGLWRVVSESLQGAAQGFVPKAEALATLAVRSRGLMRAGDQDTAAKVNAAIDALQGMDEEQWAAELGEHTGVLPESASRA